MSSEVNSEGLEVVAWQFFSDGKWYIGSELNNHRQNTEEAGFLVRDLSPTEEALAGYAARDARIATQEAQIKLLQSDANSWQSGYDEGRRMGGKHCMVTIDQLRAELAATIAHWRDGVAAWGKDQEELTAIKAQEPVVDRDLQKFNTPCAGRAYVAEWFKTVLRRHDYRDYIADRLAGDFACTLANALCQLYAAPVAKQAAETNVQHRLVQELREVASDHCGGEGYMHGLLRRAAAALNNPVARQVVMPERREPSQDNPYLSDEDREWNSCLDELVALNAADQEGGV